MQAMPLGLEFWNFFAIGIRYGMQLKVLLWIDVFLNAFLLVYYFDFTGIDLSSIKVGYYCWGLSCISVCVICMSSLMRLASIIWWYSSWYHRETEGKHDCWAFFRLYTAQYGRCYLERWMLLFLLLFIFFPVIQWLNVKDIVSFVCQHLNAFSIKLIFFFQIFFCHSVSVCPATSLY